MGHPPNALNPSFITKKRFRYGLGSLAIVRAGSLLALVFLVFSVDAPLPLAVQRERHRHVLLASPSIRA
jgi:hypothetical protein